MTTQNVIELAKKLPKPVAYVLGGGGSYGAVQVGQLQALARTDIRPDFVVGTSVGSLNGTIVAETPHSAGDRLAAFWSLISRGDIFGSTAQAISNVVTMRPAIADAGPLRDLILRSTDSRQISDLALPFTALATDIDSGELVRIRSGDLVSALLASAAIPGVFPIVEREGRRLMDGGILANIPIGVAAEQGAKTIVVLDCGFNLFAPKTHPTLPHTLLRAAAIWSMSQVKRDLAESSDRTIIYVPGKWPPSTLPYDFDNTLRNSAESYDIAIAWLRDLKIKGRGLYGAPPNATHSAAK